MIVKGDLNGAVCRNHRIKRVVPCRCLDGHVKEPYEMSMAWEPDRRSNFFFSPPAHLCAVTYMTEISLIVTLNNQFNSTQLLSKIQRIQVQTIARLYQYGHMFTPEPLFVRFAAYFRSFHQIYAIRYFIVIFVTAHKCAGGLKMLLLLIVV